jgi:hypothetical protein
VTYRDIESFVGILGFNFKSDARASYSYEISSNGMQQFSDGSHELVLSVRLNNFKTLESADMVIYFLVVVIVIVGPVRFFCTRMGLWVGRKNFRQTLTRIVTKLCRWLSPDGQWLYFTYRAMCETNTGGKFTGTDIWISRYDATIIDWGEASNNDVLNDRANSAAIELGNEATFFIC